MENLPQLVEKALEVAGKDISDMKAIAVTMGPGQLPCLSVGLNFAKALGQKFDKPVIPVNHLEAHVMTPRMIAEQQSKADFPYLSVLATGGHTEIILTRGVGLHTIMGITIDIALGTFLDNVTRDVLMRKDLVGDKAKINSFVTLYNRTNPLHKIPTNYFDGLSEWATAGQTLEKLAKYGDPTEYELPIP